jgi:cyclohexanecarboxylate-CoA ligase
MAKWDPARGIDEIERFGCTAAVTAPTFLHTLISEYNAERHDLSTLRLWTCAGAPIPAAVVQQASAALPNIKVLSLYGRSENLVTTTCSVTDDVSRALTSDGKAMPGAEVKIVDEKGHEVPRGTEGDIAYRGPAHMIEYLANPQETAALFTNDGFSKSGDLGTMTDDGFVRVTGRTKDIVIRGGMNISVREIEEHLAHHPTLQAFSVVGMPDEKLGERVCCYVVAKPGNEPPTVDALREFLLGEGMPIQKTPERVITLDSLPMTATGKVLKHELRKDIEQRLKAEHAHNQEVAGTP